MYVCVFFAVLYACHELLVWFFFPLTINQSHSHHSSYHSKLHNRGREIRPNSRLLTTRSPIKPSNFKKSPCNAQNRRFDGPVPTKLIYFLLVRPLVLKPPTRLAIAVCWYLQVLQAVMKKTMCFQFETCYIRTESRRRHELQTSAFSRLASIPVSYQECCDDGSPRLLFLPVLGVSFCLSSSAKVWQNLSGKHLRLDLGMALGARELWNPGAVVSCKSHVALQCIMVAKAKVREQTVRHRT